MNSRIKKHGNSRGLTIPSKLLEHLGWIEGTEVRIEVQNGALVVFELAPTLEVLLSSVPPGFRASEDFGDDVGKEDVE